MLHTQQASYHAAWPVNTRKRLKNMAFPPGAVLFAGTFMYTLRAGPFSQGLSGQRGIGQEFEARCCGLFYSFHPWYTFRRHEFAAMEMRDLPPFLQHG